MTAEYSPNEEDFYRAALLGSLYPLLVLCFKNLVFLRLENAVLGLQDDKGSFGDVVYRIYLICHLGHANWWTFYIVQLVLRFSLLALLAYPQDDIQPSSVSYVSWELVTSEAVVFAIFSSIMETIVYAFNLVVNVDDEIDLHHYDETLRVRSTILNSSTLSKCLEIKQRLKSATKHQQYYGSVDSTDEGWNRRSQEVLVVDYTDSQGTSIVESSAGFKGGFGMGGGGVIDLPNHGRLRFGGGFGGSVDFSDPEDEAPAREVSPSGLFRIPYINGSDVPCFIVDAFIIHRGDYDEYKDYFISRIKDSWLLVWKLGRCLANMNCTLLVSLYFQSGLSLGDKYLFCTLAFILAADIAHFELWMALMGRIPRLLSFAPSMSENLTKCLEGFSFNKSASPHYDVSLSPIDTSMEAAAESQPKSWLEKITWDYSLNVDPDYELFTDEWTNFKTLADTYLARIAILTYVEPAVHLAVLCALSSFIYLRIL